LEGSEEDRIESRGPQWIVVLKEEKEKKIGNDMISYVMKYEIRLHMVFGLPKHVCLAVYICNTMVYLKFPGLGQ
jgi:hypothetical protein